jgi:hypothetical protein
MYIAKILVKSGTNDDISAENLTLSQPNLALSESSRRNQLSQVTEAAGLNPSVQYLRLPSLRFLNDCCVIMICLLGPVPDHPVSGFSDSDICHYICLGSAAFGLYKV